MSASEALPRQSKPRTKRKATAAGGQAPTSPERPADEVTAYALSVTSGETVAGPWVRAACKRHLKDLQDGHLRGLRFDVDKAARAIGFFRDVLVLNVGDDKNVQRKPFILHPPKAFIVGSVFGWVRADTGFRRFRTAYVEEGKGNAKSPIAAGIGLYCLVADGEDAPEVYAAATKLDQAMIMFRDAVSMRDHSPTLAAVLVKNGGARCYNLAYPKRGGWFRAISSSDGQSGPRPHCSLIDELHEHSNADVVDMLSAGQKGRRQPLTFEITNSGFNKQSVCYAHHEYSIRVVQGLEENDEWFAYVCALDPQDDPFKDESCWIKANPMLGVTIQMEYLRKQVREAIGMPSKQSTVRRLNFCQWVDAQNPWIDGPTWMAVESSCDGLEQLMQCDEVFGGLDLSGTQDLTALALAGRRNDTGRTIVARVEFWTPKETMADRARNDKVPYDLWERQGHIVATPGRSVDYGFVAERIVQLQMLMPQFRSIAFDAYRITYFERELDHLGVEIKLVPHPQGFYKPLPKKDPKTGEDIPVLWFPRSIELLSKHVSEKTIEVELNPCLRWNSASAVLDADPKNNQIFSKRNSYGRIDGIVALAMAVGFLDVGGTMPAAEANIRWL